MAVANRYSDIRPSQYNPMSLQDLMMVPQYKRAQHDSLLGASSQLETELAKVDPLAYHSEAAAQEQARIQEQIRSQVELLNKEGFNNNSKQNLFKINRDYQKSISPTGAIGKINNAKQVLEANRKAHIDQSIKAGNSYEDAVRNWQMHEQQYATEYQNTGQITQIGQLGAPEYIDYIKEASEVFKGLGYTSDDIANGALSQIVYDPEVGSYVETKGGSSSGFKTNKEHVSKALNILNLQLRDPNSKLRQSLE